MAQECEKGVAMNLIEVEVKMGKDGIIQIPEAELKVMGLNEGDDICLLYIGQSDDSKVNCSKEFMIEKLKK